VAQDTSTPSGSASPERALSEPATPGPARTGPARPTTPAPAFDDNTPPQPPPPQPAELVDRLTTWARETAWVEWLELAGSLGRGAGDEYSDVDAGVGIGLAHGGSLDAVERALSGFAPTAAMLRQPFGPETTHLVSVYRDGRQLSLVVMPCAARTGLAPEAVALVDKSDRMATPLDRATWDPDADKRREWSFLACIAAGDALKHARRGTFWRALHSLTEARDLYLKLLAAQEHVIFPQFGAVSLENAGRPVPERVAATLVASPDQQAITQAVGALVPLLVPFVVEHGLEDLFRALTLDTSATQHP